MFKAKVVTFNILFFLFISFLLFSCTFEKVYIQQNAQEESEDFITEGLPFFGGSDEVRYVIYVRFYDDNHYVPYVSVKYFLQDMAEFALESYSYSDGKYSYTNKIDSKSFSMTVDVDNDTIYCPEWIGYITKTSAQSERNHELLDKILTIIRTFKGQKARTFDLGAYGMNIYGGQDDAYVPLSVMSQLFSAIDYVRYVYNGNGIYYVDGEGLINYSEYTKSSWFVNADGSTAARPQELVDFSYKLLCFTHDYLYGEPGYYGFADDGSGYANQNISDAADALNLDDLLTEYDEGTKKLLLSTSYSDYAQGLVRLIYYDYGDCHANLHWKNYIPFTAEQRQVLGSFAKSIWSSKSQKFEDTASELQEKRLAAGKTLVSADGETTAPVEVEVLAGGKTAVIRFDSFAYEQRAWASFYSQRPAVRANPNPDTLTVPLPDDTMGLFYRAFYKILNDASYASVENVILDLSLNGGGSLYACQKALSYIIGKGDVYEYDCRTNTGYHEYVTADLNLDGEVDEEDKEFFELYGNKKGRALHFAVLTSFHSFSCGNLFPNACYDNGIPIIGERSGGGSSVVAKACTAEGFPYQYSGCYRISHSNWTNVESGAPLAKALRRDQFYDDAALQATMDALIQEGYYNK